MESIEVVNESKRVAPGPRSWPVLGNIGLFRGLIPFMEGQWRLHGDVVRLNVMQMSAMLITNPDYIQHTLIGNRRNYIKGPAYDGARRFLGQGLVTLEGDAWKERRSLAQPAFHRQSLEKLTAIMVESGALFFETLDAHLKDGPKVVNGHEWMVRLTLDVVIAALFGRGTLESSQVSYKMLSEMLELLSTNANGVQLPDWVPTPRNIKFQRTIRALDSIVNQVVSAARSREDEGTLLSMLLKARDEHGNPMTDKELRDEVITIFLAGHETTALVLTWMFTMLERDPAVLKRMRAEVDSVLGGRDPSFADVSKLSYLRQVFEETMRLRPPAAMIARNAVAEDEIGGYQVVQGDTIMPFIWGAHRHPDHWPDAERFDPERFTPAAVKTRHPCAYVPFSVGPRICIGNSFALTEAVVLIAQMLVRFDFEVLPCADVKPVAIATVRPSKTVRVKFSRRNRSSASGRA